jgi:hypothetical protein
VAVRALIAFGQGNQTVITSRAARVFSSRRKAVVARRSEESAFSVLLALLKRALTVFPLNPC